MSITTVGDHLIHYEALGRGQPLIFIHGWLGSWRYWWSSMQGLSGHYRTFALDLWGFGDSSKAPDRYSLSNYVNLLDQFIERLGIALPVVLVGHALGAMVALRYAIEKPEAVSRLAAVSLPVNGGYISSQLKEGDTTALVNRVLGKTNNFPELEVESRKIDPAALNRLGDELSQIDFTGEIAQISCPLLLVFGDQDPVVQQPNGEFSYIQEPAEKRAYVTFESCAHFPMLEETAKFNRLILEFLRAESNLSDLSPKEYWQRRTY